MAEYIDSGVKAVDVGDRVGLALLHTDETPALCTGVVFKKGGIYSATLSGNFMFVDYIGPNDTTCVGCRNNLSDICSSCSRRYMDHYKKEDNNE